MSKGVHGRLLVVAAVGAAGLLTGCKPQPKAAAAPPPLAALPLSNTPAAPIVPGPSEAALPPAQPARWSTLADPGEAYAFADRAYDADAAFDDAPPDFTFDYEDGELPWVWATDGGYVCVLEPLSDGLNRYYYYEPGEDAPYLVRDTDYSYGFDRGVLVSVYDREGHALPPADIARRAAIAGAFLARGRSMLEASRQEQHKPVAAADWAAVRREIEAERAHWAAKAEANADWRAFHQAQAAPYQAFWARERFRRAGEGVRFARAMHDPGLAARDLQTARVARAQTDGGLDLTLPPLAPARAAEARVSTRRSYAAAGLHEREQPRTAERVARFDAAPAGAHTQAALSISREPVLDHARAAPPPKDSAATPETGRTAGVQGRAGDRFR